jgi:hypothetical protein
MDRKEFFKNVCKYGACSCAGMMVLSPANLLANEDTPEEKKEDWRIGFMQNRIARLVEGMNDELDKETMISLLENMGRYCAKGNSENYVKFKGDLDGYLKSIEKWVEKAEHDEEKGIVKLIGKKITAVSARLLTSPKCLKNSVIVLGVGIKKPTKPLLENRLM